MDKLPVELLRIIGRYMLASDVVHLQIVLKQEIETRSLLMLRYKHEPLTYRSFTCTYHKGCFKVTWNIHNLTVYDRTSSSNRQAIHRLGGLILQEFY